MDKSLNLLAQRIPGVWGISGIVMDVVHNTPIPAANIVITDANDARLEVVTTLADGWFYAGGLPGSATYKVAPNLFGWGFRPSVVTVDLTNSADYEIADPFQGHELTYCLSGKVIGGSGVGVPGVTVEIEKWETGAHELRMTDSSGQYSFCGLNNGFYTISSPDDYRYIGVQPLVIFYNDLYDVDLQSWPPWNSESTTAPDRQSPVEKNVLSAVKSKAMTSPGTAVKPETGPSASAVSGVPESTQADIRFYVWDHLGTTRVITDGSGNLISTHDYEPFGVEIPPATSGTVTDYPSPNTHKFTGHERDQSTGMDYMHARFYASSMGRFLRPDIIGGNTADPQSWNKYRYAANNPIGFIDPDGLKEKPPTLADKERAYKIKGSETKINKSDPNSAQNKIAYNCHSFAWNSSKGDFGDPSNANINIQMPKWDNSPKDDIKETGAVALDNDAPNQVGDRVVWTDAKGDQIHSAVVTEVDTEGNTTQVTGKNGDLAINVDHPALTGYPGTRTYYRLTSEQQTSRSIVIPDGEKISKAEQPQAEKEEKTK